jgi:cytochrome c oxidase subunit 1
MHDTYFVVAHFHYVLSIGAVFGIITSLCIWLPQITKIKINYILFRRQYLLLFIGVNLTFFPQHFIGLGGIPRRYRDFPDEFLTINIISTFGRTVSIVSCFLFLYILLESIFVQRVVIKKLSHLELLEFCEHEHSSLILIYFNPTVFDPSWNKYKPRNHFYYRL